MASSLEKRAEFPPLGKAKIDDLQVLRVLVKSKKKNLGKTTSHLNTESVLGK